MMVGKVASTHMRGLPGTLSKQFQDWSQFGQRSLLISSHPHEGGPASCRGARKTQTLSHFPPWKPYSTRRRVEEVSVSPWKSEVRRPAGTQSCIWERTELETPKPSLLSMLGFHLPGRKHFPSQHRSQTRQSRHLGNLPVEALQPQASIQPGYLAPPPMFVSPGRASFCFVLFCFTYLHRQLRAVQC